MKRKTKVRRDAAKGMTLIELLAGLSAASILAITAGVMLFYVFRAWQQNLDRVHDQQDGSVAMYTLERNIRGASSLVTILPGEFQVAATNGRIMSFFVDAQRLYHMPDIAEPTKVIRVTDLPVSSFAATNVDDGVEVTLELQGSQGPLQTRAVVHFRN